MEASQRLNTYIDHTILKPEATPQDVVKLCQEAVQHGFASVCVNPVYVRLAADTLKGLQVAHGHARVCCTVGFPLGATGAASKESEARQAIQDGAGEIDMVIAIGLLRARELEKVREEIQRVVAVCRTHDEQPVICKVIIETSLLTEEEKVIACRLAMEAKADYVKTSTGFSSGGATVSDVELMAAEVHGKGGKVKASGGIRSKEFALQLIEAGASRIGTSSGVELCGGECKETARGGY